MSGRSFGADGGPSKLLEDARIEKYLKIPMIENGRMIM